MDDRGVDSDEARQRVTGRRVRIARGAARVSQVVDYLFFLVYGLLTLRFLLALVAARSSAGFVRALVAISDPFYAPFRGIVTSSDLGAGHVIVLSFVVALVVYLAGHLAVHEALRVIGRPRVAV